MATASPGTRFDSAGESLTATTAGVAALDTPQLNQTKLEIRALVAEVAALAASDIKLFEFLDDALPRICNAMGASAAALWCLQTSSPQSQSETTQCASSANTTTVSSNTAVAAANAVRYAIRLAGNYKLPDLLLGDSCQLGTQIAEAIEPTQADSPQAVHLRILQCVIDEAAPILVPPKSTPVGAARPANPLDQSLLIVPVKLFDHCEALLEVIQPHCGGPAAQRGYLRFVAQMADLVAEFLRRQRLRELTLEAHYIATLRQTLAVMGNCADQRQRWQHLADAWTRLLPVDVAMVLTSSTQWIPGFQPAKRVIAISQIQNFDPRSQAVLAAQRWLAQIPSRQLAELQVIQLLQLTARSAPSTNESERANAQQATSDRSADPAIAPAIDPACLLASQLNCPTLMRFPLSGSAQAVQIILGIPAEANLQQLRERASELSGTLAPLVMTGSRVRNLLHAPGAHSIGKWKTVERLVVRASTVLLVIAIGLFPVTDQLSAVAVLEAVDKQFYFAPSTAEVREILVSEQQSVSAGQPLLILADRQLESRIKELTGQLESVKLQLEQDLAALKRGRLDRPREEELVGRIDQLKITRDSLAEQLEILNIQQRQLTITARSDAIVTTWDTRNRLESRQVTAGQLLLSTCSTRSRWQLKLSVPESQAGRVREALTEHTTGLPVQFSLSSHPTQVQMGRLVSLSDQLVKDQDGRTLVMATVLIDAEQLPNRTDGAVARAAIDCGNTVAIWLLVRDAWRQTFSWWRML